jgi:hypothetical protein
METFLIISMLLAFTSWQPLISCPKDCHGDYVIDNYNVSLLPLAGVWPTVFYHSDDPGNIHNIPTFFNISLCSSSLTSQGCTNGGSTCYTDDFRSYYTLGTTDSCQYQVKNRILTLSYSFSSSAVNEFGSGNVTISLVCGPSLVSVEVSPQLHMCSNVCVCPYCWLYRVDIYLIYCQLCIIDIYYGIIGCTRGHTRRSTWIDG